MAAAIIFRKELEKADDPDKLLQEKIKEYRATFANPYRAAEHLHIDDVIDPAETRSRLIKALEMAIDKKEQRPEKKHGIMPTEKYFSQLSLFNLAPPDVELLALVGLGK